MKTTLDLPDELVKQLKLRAIHEGKKLKETVAETLRAGLAVPKTSGRKRASRRERAVVKRDRSTGLPVIQCRHAAARGQEMTADRVSEILAAQEAAWASDA